MVRFFRLAAGLLGGFLVFSTAQIAGAQETTGTPQKAFPGNIFEPSETAFPGNIFEPETQAFPGNIFDPGPILFPGNIFDLVASVDETVFALAQASPEDRDALSPVYDRRSDLRKRLSEIAALCQQGHAAGTEAQIAEAVRMLEFQKRFAGLAKQSIATPDATQVWLKETHAAAQSLILFQKEVGHDKR